jgi:hypothetical protein
MAPAPKAAVGIRVPAYYRLFFLTVEPLAALSGAVMIYYDPRQYLSLTHAPSAPSSSDTLPLSSNVVLLQLANLYTLFAFNEAFLLRCTSDLRVWKVILFGLLLADFGHLWSVAGIDGGGGGLTNFSGWNVMGLGNVLFVYIGAATRLCFLAGIGMGGTKLAK